MTTNDALSVHYKGISLKWVTRNGFLEEVTRELRVDGWSSRYLGPRGRKAVPQRGQMCSNDSNVGKPLKKAKGTVAYGMRPEERVLKAAV